MDKEENKIKKYKKIIDRDTYNYLYFLYHHIHERGTSVNIP